MGAADFKVFIPASKNSTAKSAFSEAVDAARWEHGNGGYTGTIAEKDGFMLITPEEDETTEECVDRLLYGEDDGSTEEGKVSDKWGPAGCVETGRGYLFFGWASS